ncbi:hypothetical protein [Cereibacter sphaeroides]|uniref:hypothetical protein n=1 Tax=Cereibacter sphaeroides TaxID=1063 RepID=UPI003FCCDA39
MSIWSAVVASLIFVCGLASSAQAHSPYFGQREKIELPGFGMVEFAVLFGDGIVVTDPSQVVVFDSEGYLLAATPQSDALTIHCEVLDGQPQCRVYDELWGLVFEPDYSKWTRDRLIEAEGRPPNDAYPEYMDIEYGFTSRHATFREVVFHEAIDVARSPITSTFALLWWIGAWACVLRPAWKWKRNSFRLRPFKVWSVALGVLGILTFVVMWIMTVVVWLTVEPYSILFFLFVFVLGAVIAAVLTRPKAVVQEV